MKVAVCSDLHVDCYVSKYDLPWESFFENGVEAVFVAGDVANDVAVTSKWLERQLETMIRISAVSGRSVITMLYVPGNHEYYHTDMTTSKLEYQAIERRWKGAFVLLDALRSPTRFPRGDGTIVVMGDTLWTDFRLNGEPSVSMNEGSRRMNDFRLIKKSPAKDALLPQETADIHDETLRCFEEELDWLSDDDKLVIMTHHAPSYESVDEQYREPGLSALNPCFASGILDPNSPSYRKKLSERVDFWFHGHVHGSFDYKLGRTNVVCSPRGYPTRYGPENPGWEPRIVEI